MSIEKQLSEAFKHNSSSLQCPPSLENRIMEEYDKAVTIKGRSVKMVKKKRLWKIAMIAAIIALLCGFAYGGKLLMSDSTTKLTFEMYSNKSVQISEDTLEKARAKLKEVESMLAPGETAIVYLPEVNKAHPLNSVAKLNYIDDLQQWQSFLEEQDVLETLPSSILDGTYQFEGGAQGNPFYPAFYVSHYELIDEMEAESKVNDSGQPIWRLANETAIPGISFYSSVYRAGSGEAIHLSWQIFSDSKFKVEAYISPNTEFEELVYNDKKARYTKNHESLLAENGVLQSVSWIGESHGKSVIYSLESDSPSMTKERIVEVFESLH